MSDKVWSQEQREAAQREIYRRMVGKHLSTAMAAVDLQCELTAKDAELAEAVELLRKLMQAQSAKIPNFLILDIEDLVMRNTPQEASDETSGT